MDWKKASAQNMAQLEMVCADKRADLDEDRQMLAELRAGADVRSMLERWMDRAIRQSEVTLREMEQYVQRFKATMDEAAKEREGGP